MYHGGVKINNRTIQIIRFASLIMPIILALYGMFIRADMADSSHYVGDITFLSIIVPWVLLASFSFLFQFNNKRAHAVSVIGCHVFAILYILLVSGFGNPIIVGWIMLFLASYIYFDGDGLRLSIVVLVATAAADAVINAENSAVLISDIITAVVLLIVGMTAIVISDVQEIDSAELRRSQEQQKLERDRILTIVNNLSDAILSTDENGIIRVYNASTLNLLDTNANLDGKNIDEVLNLVGQNNKKIKLLSDMKKARAVFKRDDVTMNIADETVRLEVTYSPIKGAYNDDKTTDKKDGYILILRDITKAKSLEEEKDEFISVVSHELRTPITIVEGTLSNVQLMMGRSDISMKVMNGAVTTAHDQVLYLARMVNDLSTLSRAERGVADSKEEIDVRNLIKELYAEYAPQAEKKNLHLNMDLGMRLGTVTASRLYLQELLQNFLTNSIKYTKEGAVTIHIHNKDGLIHFSVSDTGIGISKVDQSKIFDKFYRSEDYRTRETGGTGLGLYVAVKLAKKLNTKIELTSRLNHGSTFSFTLPVEADKA